MNYVPAIMINKSGQINQSTFGIRKKQQCVHAMIKEVFQFGQLYRKENEILCKTKQKYQSAYETSGKVNCTNCLRLLRKEY